ncbi:hypothetical protein E3N88_11654 [Mikania micrantha]|uniref:Uncharacterized protein n=1 Tax=Mikania micrantha TaxID=192012 RepID=A0A5N6PED8_9ASTR|nr:hypothetical protein E3N88_11654 [Mikania micrantha]
MDPSINYIPHVEKPPDPSMFPPLDSGNGKRCTTSLAVSSKSKKKKQSTGMALRSGNNSRFVSLDINNFVGESKDAQPAAHTKIVAQDDLTIPCTEVGLSRLGSGIVMATMEMPIAADHQHPSAPLEGPCVMKRSMRLMKKNRTRKSRLLFWTIWPKKNMTDKPHGNSHRYTQDEEGFVKQTHRKAASASQQKLDKPIRKHRKHLSGQMDYGSPRVNKQQGNTSSNPITQRRMSELHKDYLLNVKGYGKHVNTAPHPVTQNRNPKTTPKTREIPVFNQYEVLQDAHFSEMDIETSLNTGKLGSGMSMLSLDGIKVAMSILNMYHFYIHAIVIISSMFVRDFEGRVGIGVGHNSFIHFLILHGIGFCWVGLPSLVCWVLGWFWATYDHWVWNLDNYAGIKGGLGLLLMLYIKGRSYYQAHLYTCRSHMSSWAGSSWSKGYMGWVGQLTLGMCYNRKGMHIMGWIWGNMGLHQNYQPTVMRLRTLGIKIQGVWVLLPCCIVLVQISDCYTWVLLGWAAKTINQNSIWYARLVLLGWGVGLHVNGSSLVRARSLATAGRNRAVGHYGLGWVIVHTAGVKGGVANSLSRLGLGGFHLFKWRHPPEANKGWDTQSVLLTQLCFLAIRMVMGKRLLTQYLECNMVSNDLLGGSWMGQVFLALYGLGARLIKSWQNTWLKTHQCTSKWVYVRISLLSAALCREVLFGCQCPALVLMWTVPHICFISSHEGLGNGRYQHYGYIRAILFTMSVLLFIVFIRMKPSNEFLPSLEKPPDPNVCPILDPGTGKHKVAGIAEVSKKAKKRDATGSVIGGKNKSTFTRLNVDQFANEMESTHGMDAEVCDKTNGTKLVDEGRQSEGVLGLSKTANGVMMELQFPHQSTTGEVSTQQKADLAMCSINGEASIPSSPTNFFDDAPIVEDAMDASSEDASDEETDEEDDEDDAILAGNNVQQWILSKVHQSAIRADNGSNNGTGAGAQRKRWHRKYMSEQGVKGSGGSNQRHPYRAGSSSKWQPKGASSSKNISVHNQVPATLGPCFVEEAAGVWLLQGVCATAVLPYMATALGLWGLIHSAIMVILLGLF